MAKNFLIKSAFWITVAEVIYNISGYIVHSGVGRILGPADYGRYGLVVTLTTMVIILIGRGIPTAMSKCLSEIVEADPGLVATIKKKAAILQIAVIGVITVIFFLSAPLISMALGDPSLTPLFRISASIIPAFAAAAFYVSYFTGLHYFNIQSILKVFRALIRIAAIIGLAFFFQIKGSILGYAVAAFGVFTLGYAIDRLRVSKKFKMAAKGVFDWRNLVGYAWPMTLFMIFYEVLITIDLYMVKGILQDDAATGIYNAALTIGRLPYYFFYALTLIILPVISKMTAEKNHTEARRLVSQSLRLMIILLFPAVTLMVLYSQQLVRLFFGAPYAEAALPMAIFSVGVGFLTVFYVMSFVMNGSGKVKNPMIITFIGVILNALLNYFMINRFGIVGAAAATSITSFFLMLAILSIIKKNFGVRIDLKTLFQLAIGAALIVSVSLVLPKSLPLFMVSGAMLGAIYFSYLYFFGCISPDDIMLVKKLLSKRKNKKIPIAGNLEN